MVSSQNSGQESGQQTRGFSESISSLKRQENGHKHPSHDDRTDEDEDFANKRIISSAGSVPVQFGRFCGQMSVSEE